MIKNIVVKGAREHNLKDVDLTIPRDELVVITGLSGSGKSSLAFDTMYAEGQRRYVESLSSYARMFLGQMEKPDIDSIEGLSPAISIDQKTTARNPRSTVGTVTEIYEFLRFLDAPSNIITKAPSAGLFEGQTDEAEMGVTYAELDAFLAGERIPDDKRQRIERMHSASEHKRAGIAVYRKK